MKKIYYLFVLVILSLGIYVNPVEGRGDLYSSKAIRALEKLIDSQGNLGTSVTWGAGIPGQDIVWTFDGESGDGTFGYYEDEDQFRFSETVYITTTNQDGIVFGSLGTATKGIDLSGSGLSGTDDWIYNSTTNYWRANGVLVAGDTVQVGNSWLNTTGFGTDTNNDLSLMPNGYGQIISSLDSNTAHLSGNKTAIGSLTSCTSNATTTITKTSHGLSLAVGDLVHVTGATTAADKDFYTLVSSTANTLVVNKALTGSDADVALTVYKDVIGFFATGGAGFGQRVMNYSHQDQPLQLGGDVSITTANMGTEDILIGNVLGWVNRTTEPGGALTNGIMIYAEDSADSTSAMSWRTEQVAEAIGTFTESDKIKIQINGVWYWISLDAV